MVRFLGVNREFHVLAAVLSLSVGRVMAAAWEDGIVLGDDLQPADSSVLHRDTAESDRASPGEGDLDPGTLSPGAGSAAAIAETAGPTLSESVTWCSPQASGAASAQPICPPPCGQACWSFRADALLLWRNAPASRPIYSNVVPDTETLGSTALNANDLNSDLLAAPRLSLFRTSPDGQTLEATYLYAGNFYSEKSLPYSPDGYATSPPGIYGNDWGPPDTNLDSASAKLLGQLQSVEFNLRYPVWTDTCQFLIGSRWVQWNETLQMQDSFSYVSPDPVTGKDTYETRCFNNLWGGQIGLDALLLGSPGTTRIEGLVKAGAYYNGAGQASTFRYKQSDDFYYDNQARAGGPPACSFVGEIGLTAVIPISCCCDFRCGYYGLWLTNIAQPTRQLSDQTINQFESAGTLDTAGSLILQGLSLGLESRF